LAGPDSLYGAPDWANLQWYEYFSAVLIGIYVLLVIGLMWSFLASFYLSGSTIIYLLLRRDVDDTDLADIYVKEDDRLEEASEAPGAGAPVAPAAAGQPTDPSASPQLEPPSAAAPDGSESPASGGEQADSGDRAGSSAENSLGSAPDCPKDSG
jgi:hypothetical protein